MAWTVEETTKYLEGFSKNILELWFTANASNRVNRLDRIPKIYSRDIDSRPNTQRIVQEAVESQRDKFINISINGRGREIPVLISSDGFVVVRYIEDQTFFAFKVLEENNTYKLKITGIDYSYERNKYRSGCKTKYLVKFFEDYCGVPILVNRKENTTITEDEQKVDQFRRHFLRAPIIKGQQIFQEKKAIGGQSIYYNFYLKLINRVQNREEIEANINFYRNALTGDYPTQIQLEYGPIFTDDALPIGSPYYMERRLIDERCLSAIKEPAAFIRIKGSRKMGKTSLLYRIIENGVNEEYSTIFIDFAGVESETINNFKYLCVWLCQQVTEQLQQEDLINNYFSDAPSHMRATTRYFSQHILTLEQPILFAMDNVDKVFENSDVATPLCNMLASWHRQSRVPNTLGRRWAKLRIVLAHATDVYLDWDINHSPLQGIGYVPDLLDWDSQQIKQFAEIYGVDLTQQDIQQLRGLIGGHPYLVRLAVEYLYDNQGSNIETLLQIATTSASPFNDYLFPILVYLRKYPQQYANAFRQILEMSEIQVDDQFELDKIEFKLKSLDLIRIDQNQRNYNFYPKYNLYSHFFRRYLINEQPV